MITPGLVSLQVQPIQSSPILTPISAQPPSAGLSSFHTSGTEMGTSRDPKMSSADYLEPGQVGITSAVPLFQAIKRSFVYIQ